jgi:hypothetical protein
VRGAKEMKSSKMIYLLVFALFLAAGCGSEDGSSSDGGSGDIETVDTVSGDGDDESCNDDNNIDQPDMTGSPIWSSSTTSFGSEVQLNVPVDKDTGYVNVVLHHTQNEGGRWIATGGFGAIAITPGNAQSVSVPVQISAIDTTPQPGNYFPTITICRSEAECLSGTDTNVSYAGGGTAGGTVTSGDMYMRVHNEGFENVRNSSSCYIVPILTVTQ